MKTALVILAMLMATPAFSAEFSISFKEASHTPLAGFIEVPYAKYQKLYLGPDSGIKAANVASMKMAENDGEPVLAITLDTAGGLLNQIFTNKLIRKPSAIIINGKVVAVPLILSPSNEHIWVAGLTKEEIARIIESFGNR